MPNKKTGVYKGKPRRELGGFYSEEDRIGDAGVPGMSAIPEENLNFLLDIFPNVDKEIIQDVLLEFSGSLNDAIEKLSEISAHTMEEKSSDLAIIACSLLTDESQPMGVASLNRGPEGLGSDLGSAALSNSFLHDQQNQSSMRNFSLPANIEESSGGSIKHINPSLLKNGIVKNALPSVNGNSLWLEKPDHAEVNNCKSYNIYGSENNKAFKPKPDFLYSFASSNNFVEETEDSKSRKELVNELSWFPNIATATTHSSSEALVLNTSMKMNIDNSDRSIPNENSHNREINTSTAEIRMQRNVDKKVYKSDRTSLPEVNGTSDLTNTGNLNTPDNLLNSWSNVLSGWDQFYSDIESSGFNTHCDNIKLANVGRSGHTHKSVTPSAAEIKTHVHRSSAYSEHKKSSGQLKVNKSQSKRDLKQKNSVAKTAAYVGSNYTFQTSGIVPSSLGATHSIGQPSSHLATSFSPSAQNISTSLVASNSTALPSSNLVTPFSSSAQSIAAPLGTVNSTVLSNINIPMPFSSSAQSIGSSNSTVSREDHGNSKKEADSQWKLSAGALEFTPRTLAKKAAFAHKRTAQFAASPKNQKPSVAEEVQPFPVLPPQEKKNSDGKRGEHQNEDTGSVPYGDQNCFLLSGRKGDHASYSEDTRQDCSVKSEKNVDPMDPLGWSDIFSESTSSLLDPKPQRSRKARKLSGGKPSPQPTAPEPTFSPWHTPSESHHSATRSSPPKKQDQEFPGETFSTSFGTIGASTSYPIHTKSENEKMSAISSTQTIGNTSIATRLPPSLTSTASPGAAVNPFIDTTSMSSSLVGPKKMLSESDVRIQRPAAVSTQGQLLQNKLQFRGVKTPVGVIRRYALEKQPVVIILRGLPGSGKSYLAKQLLIESQRMDVQGDILSTDDFFTGVGQYCYNRNDLPEAHDWNKKRALQCVKDRRSPVIIDNTNTTMWELLPYAVMALEHGYDIQMFEPDTPWRMKVTELARKNTHGVKKENIKRMKERWENFTLDDVIKQASHSVASRHTVAVVPVDSPLVTPAAVGQPHPAVKKQVTAPGKASITEVNHQNGTHCVTDQDLGLSDIFCAQTSQTFCAQTSQTFCAQTSQTFCAQTSQTFCAQTSQTFCAQTSQTFCAQTSQTFCAQTSQTFCAQTSQTFCAQTSQTFCAQTSQTFCAQTSQTPHKVKKKMQSPYKSPKHEITQDFLNQSLKKAMVNLRKASSPQSEEDSPCNSNLPQSVGLPVKQSSQMFPSNQILTTERQLSEKGCNSDSETPTVDKDVLFFGKTSTDHANVPQSVQKEAVVSSADFPGEMSQNEAGVLNCSLSTDSFRTVRSSSDISSYHTGDGGEDLLADVISDDDDSGETVPSDQDVLMLLKESHEGQFPAVVVNAEDLPGQLKNMSLNRDEVSLVGYMQHGSKNDSGYSEKQGVENTSSSVDPAKISSTDFSGIVSGLLAGSSPKESADHVLNTVAAPSSENIDSKNTCLDSSTHKLNNDGYLPDVLCPPSLVNYSDSDGDSGQESPGDVVVCNEFSQLCIDDHAGGPVNVCCSQADNEGNTVGEQIENSGYVGIEQSTSRCGLAQGSEIIADKSDQNRDICAGGSVERGVELVPESRTNIGGLVQDRNTNVHKSVQGNDICLHGSVQEAGISSVWLDQDREITVDRSFQDKDSSVHRSTPDREPSVDSSSQGSEDSTHSGREQSPDNDTSAPIVDLQAKTKKKRIRKGRNPGPFIEEALKVKSKSQNWSSFVVQSSECSQSSGESVVLETEGRIVDTRAATTQTDPYDFSIVYKLNSPAFNSLQPVDWALRGVNVISSSSEADIHRKLQATEDEASVVSFRKTSMTADQSTITDEALEKEVVDLETLKSCFPEYSRKQLEATMSICHYNLEWVTSHLLDSPALYDMEDEEEEGSKDGILKSGDPVVSISSSSIRSLADMCTVLVKETNKVDLDDLEMQVIQVGEGRLQKIEMFNRYRCHSLSHDDHCGKEYWSNDVSHDEIRAKLHFKKKKSDLKHIQSVSLKASTFDPELSAQNSSSLSIPDSEKPSTSRLQGQERQTLVHPSVNEGNGFSSSPIVEVAASEVNESAKSAVVESQPVLPMDFVRHLERLYGPLAISLDDGASGLVLDDSTARRIYNCLKLKLQGTKNVVKGSQADQLKTDEALARALQDEENTRTSLNASHATNSLIPGRQNTVPGWSNETPSWMAQTGGGIGGGSVNISEGTEHFRPQSIADTLHRLRGSIGGRVQPHKLQHRKSGSVKSVWTGSRRRGHVDSLISIMQEEMDREEQQREQLRLIEANGDMEALATRIKRIELSHLFPSMGPDVLEDIFRSTGYSKEETIRVLYQCYNIPPVPMSQDKEEILNQLRKSQERFEYAEDINEEDTPSEDSESSYEGYRDEARFFRQLAMDCQQQALRYQSNGMQGAALFYRQRAKKYKEDEKVANSRAANVLFDKGSDRLQLENTLDLHFYRLDEAINAVNVAIELKEDEYRKKPDKKNSYLDIVTGWGRNSKNGKAKLKPAIIHHLYAKSFQYEEKSAGMLRVYLCKKL